MSDRQQMLERIRKALGREPGNAASARSALTLPELGAVLPTIPPEELVSRFEEELAKVGGTTHRAGSVAELEAILQKLLEPPEAAAVVLSRNPLLGECGLPEKLTRWGKQVWRWSDASGPPTEPEATVAFRQGGFAAGVGITGVDCVLAESGTLVLSSTTEGSQLASLAPPTHVALYRREQVLGSLEEVLERLPVPRDPQAPAAGRAVVFITGPSRTADIEQILIRGVHGPRDVHAVLVEEECVAEARRGTAPP